MTVAAMAMWASVCGATKPTPPVDIAISTNPEVLVPNTSGTIVITVTPNEEIAHGQACFRSSDESVVRVGDAKSELGAMTLGQTYTASTRIEVVGLGKCEVRCGVYSLAPNGDIRFGYWKTLYVIASPTGVLSGTTSFIDLEIADLKSQRTAKTISRDDYDARLHHVLGGGAIESTSVQPNKVGQAPSKGNAYIYGSIYWTDSGGAPHAVQNADVEIWDKNAVADELLMTAQVYYGSYYVYIDNTDTDGPGGRDIYIRVLTNNSNARIMNAATGKTYFLESTVTNDIADDSNVVINLTANNADANNQAFCVNDAVYNAVVWASYMGGLLNKIDVDFPTTDDTSNFSNGILHILSADWPDWDVIFHEYGHYFMDEKNIENNPGGQHSSRENLGERLAKEEAIRLAWGEGFPTYFGTSGQVYLGLSYMGIPNVGDTFYTDTIDYDPPNNYDLEGPTDRPSLGEDNELSVARILYDLFDGTSDARDDVSLYYYGVFGAAQGVNATTLSQFWNGLINAKAADIKTKEKYGCIFADHKVAPEPTSPTDNAEINATDPPPTFRWTPNGGGPSHRNNRFKVQFWKQDYSSMLFESTEQNLPRYTPSQADWQTIRNGDKVVRWMVLGKNADDPETGEYISCSRSISGGDIAFVIDDTGSMTEEIDGVKAALTLFISLLDVLDAEVAVNLISFKDDVTDRIFSTDLTAVQAQVNTLFADGGGDCPEASVEALNRAARNLKPGAVIFLATDADAHAGLDIGATITALRAKGIRVNVLLSGSCSKSLGKYEATANGIVPSINCHDCDGPNESADESKDDLPTNAVALYSLLSTETGGVFSFVPEVNNPSDPTGEERYQNGAFNVMRASALPAIPGATPGWGFQGTTVDVTFTGANTNFTVGSVLSVSGSGITVNSGTAASAVTYTANLTIAPDAATGFRDVTITTTHGKTIVEEAIGTGAFEIKQAPIEGTPTIVGISPATTTLGSTLDVHIYGVYTHWDESTTLYFGYYVTVNSISVESPTHLIANVTVSSDTYALGYEDVTTYTYTSGESASESVPGPLLILSNATSNLPRILSIEPVTAERGATTNVTVVGENTNFVDGVSTSAISGDGVTVLSTSVTDATHATISVLVDAGASIGFRDIVVTTDSEVAAILDALEISGGAPEADAGPDQIVVTQTASALITLDGTNSTAFDATIASYAWTGLIDPEDVAQPEVTAPWGSHVFSLIVTDSLARVSAPDTVTVIVRSASDINGDGVVEAVDVQLVINAALELEIGDLDADVNNDGVVDAVDVQLVINAALGL